MNKIVFLWILISNLCAFAKPAVHYTQKDTQHAHITISFKLLKNDCLYSDYLTFSTNSPHIVIESSKTDVQPTNQFDADFKETKRSYLEDTTVTIDLLFLQPAAGCVNVSYYQKSNKKIDALSIPVSSLATSESLPTHSCAPVSLEHTHTTAIHAPPLKKEAPRSWADAISNTLKTTDSLWVRILFALILGLLLSLTPCIYPMIPITVGILQSQGTRSLFKNFLLAATYTTGIATTFALLGVAAAFTGQVFGSLLAKPLFVYSLVIFLLYLAGSMIGLYDMYMPSFLQSNNNQYKGGSLVSIFLFGAVSGTIASPCLSPGLFLLLTLVTTLGSKLIGFILLFAFGIGLGIPLLIIGTFSSSLNVLPSAGMWMVEVKKFFGFIMIGMCFFYLKNIIAWNILLWMMAATLCAIGVFYFYNAQRVFGWRKIYNTVATLFIIASTFLGFKAFQTLYPIPVVQKEGIQWMTDYNKAKTTASNEHKNIFVDISAPYCSICKAIDKKILHTQSVVTALEQFVSLKIDNDEPNKHHEELQAEWSIKGFPAFLIINPETQHIITQWGSEVYDLTPAEFIEKIEKYI